MDDEFWKAVREREQATGRSSPIGAINLALLFGTAAIALSLILTPLLADSTGDRDIAAGRQNFDMLTTGSIPAQSEKGARRYTIRRSVLQETPGAVCIIDINGNKSGC